MICLWATACGGRAPEMRRGAAFERIAWDETVPLGEGALGAEAFEAILPDSRGHFFVFGKEGVGHECSSLYPEADTDTLTTDVACDGFVVDGEPDIYGAVHLPEHRVLVGSLDGEGWIGVQALDGDPTDVLYADTWSGIDAMFGVARYGIDGFIAVGEEGTVITTAPRNPTGAPDGQQQLNPSLSAWVQLDPIAEGLMDEGSALPDLRAVTRLGPGNVVVGDDDDGGDDNHDQPVVWVFRPKPRDPSGSLSWDRWVPMEMANATNVDLYAVSVDEVHGYLERDRTELVDGNRINGHRGFVLAAGTAGRVFRFEVRLSDAQAGDDDDEDVIYEPWTQAYRQWGAGAYKFYGLWTDERTRTVVGDNGLTSTSRRPIVLTLARTEDFGTSPLWLDRSPAGSDPIVLTGVASNSSYYAAVGVNTSNGDGVVYRGHEAVVQCSVRAAMGSGTWTVSLRPCLEGTPAIGGATQLQAGDALVSLTEGGEMTFADTDISPLGGDTDLDTDLHVEIGQDPKSRLQTWELSLVGLGDTDDTNDTDDTDIFQVEVSVVPDLAGNVTLTGEVFTCRFPDPPTSFDGFRDLIYETTWRRDSLQFFPSTISRYRLYRDTGEGIPYQVPAIAGHPELSPQAFADILTGWMVDDRDDTTPEQRDTNLDPLNNAWCPQAQLVGLEEDGLEWADSDEPATDIDLTGSGPERLLYGISRYRNIIGHSMADDYEGFRDGMEWRYMRMRNDFFGLCERGPGPPQAPEGHAAYWTETCCRTRGEEWAEDANTDGDTDWEDTLPEAEDTDDLVPDTTLYFDVFAPVDGTVYLLPDPGEVAPCPCENDMDAGEDRCDVCTGEGGTPGVDCISRDLIVDNYGAGGDESAPCNFLDGAPRKASRLPAPSMNIAVVNHQGNVVFRMLHVESCLENGTEVLAGQRVGRVSAWQEMDLEVWYNSDRDRWRAISYFELLPDALYAIYEAKFGFAPRGSEGPSDPIIPLEQRDACPGLPVDDEPADVDTDTPGDTDPTPLEHPDPAPLQLGCEALDFADAGGDLPTCGHAACTVALPVLFATDCAGVRCERESDADSVPPCPCTSDPGLLSGNLPECDGWSGCSSTDTDSSNDCACDWKPGGVLPTCYECALGNCTQPVCPTNLIRRLDIGGPL
ncbi:MAG TPA: hypothetical protein PKA64_02280 [Myxococcota bacterium]|nr:hypothetical protein [Myxococcota bacterium]